jgi:hypothetical protein
MRACELTKTEQTNVRTALLFLRTRLGGWGPVAQALQFSRYTLAHMIGGGKTIGPGAAVGVAHLAGVSVDDVLSGRYPAPGTCPHCGHRPDFIEEETNPG